MFLISISFVVIIDFAQGKFHFPGKKLRNLKSSWAFAEEERRFAVGIAWPSLQTTIHVPVSNLICICVCLYLYLIGIAWPSFKTTIYVLLSNLMSYVVYPNYKKPDVLRPFLGLSRRQNDVSLWHKPPVHIICTKCQLVRN